MSQQAVANFIEKLNSDAALQAKIDQIDRNDPEAFLTAAKAAGYDFSASEWNLVVGTNYENISAEKLSEADLESVAGGVGDLVIEFNLTGSSCWTAKC